MTVETQSVQASVAIGTWGWSNIPGVPKQNETKAVHTNSGTWDIVDHLYIHQVDNTNTNQEALLSRLKAGDVLILTNANDDTNLATFLVNSISVNSGTYYTIPAVSQSKQGDPPADNIPLNVSVVIYIEPTVTDGHMLIDILMQPSVTKDIVPNLMEYFCDYLQTVTHLVNHVALSANVGGVIISDEEDILPATAGEPFP